MFNYMLKIKMFLFFVNFQEKFLHSHSIISEGKYF